MDPRPAEAMGASHQARHIGLDHTAPVAVVKTYLACAIGLNACLQGYSVRYYRVSRLMLTLTQSKADGSYQKMLLQLQ